MSKFFPLKLRGISSFHVAYLSVLWLLLIAANDLNAQDVPKAINYQAIVRDSETMLPISDQGAYVSIEFLDGPYGDILYQEEFYSIRTGISGLINLSLGQGDPVINTFDNVSWETGNVWLRISVDVGSGLNILQEIPFNTVPYAFYAQDSGGSDDDNDPTNELIQNISLNDSQLEITEGNETTTIDLSSLINDNDPDPTNERIDSLRYNTVEGILSVFESGSQFDVDLGLNELEQGTIQDLSYDEDGHTLSITDNEEATTVNLTPYLDNTDAQTLSLDGTVLELSGSESSVDLTDLLNTDVDLDPNPLNELQDLSLSADSLLLTDGAGVDLSAYLDNTDNQALTLTDSILSLSGDVTTSVNLAPLLEFEADGSETIVNNGQNTTVNGTGTTSDPYTIDVPDNLDNNPANEIQTIESLDGSVNVTPNGNDFDLSVSAADGSETIVNNGQNTTVNGTGTTSDPYTIDVPDNLDNNPANEIQTIESLDGSVNVTPNGNDFDLSVSAADGSETIVNNGQNTTVNGTETTSDPYTIDVPDNLDNNPANEIQTIESLDGSVNVTPNGNDFDLSVSAADGSETIVNNGQNTMVNGTGTTSDPYSIAVPDNLDNSITNEIQDISTNSTPGNIEISDGSTLTLNVDDADSDATNELQTVESTDGSVTVTQDDNDFDLSVAAADGSETIVNNGQNTTINGTGTTSDPYTIDVPDNLDNSITNEIQDLNLTGDDLTITGNGSPTTIDLSPYDNSDLSQNHIFLGDASGEAQEVQVTGDVNIASDGNITVTGIQSVDVSSAAPTDGQVLVYDGGAGEWIPATPPSVTPSAETQYYSIDPLDFRQLVDNNIGVPFDTENTLVFFDDEAPFAMLRDEGGLREIMAPIHLPQGAEINNLKVYFRDSGPGVMWFRLYRKNLTDYSLSNDFLTSIVATGPDGDRTVDLDVNNLNVVDNSTYVYRLYVRFTAFENNDNEGDADEIEQRVYGAVVEYTTD